MGRISVHLHTKENYLICIHLHWSVHSIQFCVNHHHTNVCVSNRFMRILVSCPATTNTKICWSQQTEAQLGSDPWPSFTKINVSLFTYLVWNPIEKVTALSTHATKTCEDQRGKWPMLNVEYGSLMLIVATVEWSMIDLMRVLYRDIPVLRLGLILPVYICLMLWKAA